jgi:LCP family protein required for cell wall assembly
MNWQDPYQSNTADEETQPMPFTPGEETRPMPVSPLETPPAHHPVEWVDPNGPIQPIPIQRSQIPAPPSPSQGVPRKTPKGPGQRRRGNPGCLSCLILLLIPLGVLAVYFLLPLRTNLLLLGIDRTSEGTAMGRSDTIILVSVIPLKPTVNLLSIPRDLWVEIPGQGENRINTAHFFAEIEEEGSGPAAAAETVRQNFGVPVNYYVRLRFDGFLNIIQAMGGVDVDLPTSMAGLAPGAYHLDPDQALAFARERRGADDFFRMENTQFLILSAARQMLKPASWPKIPAVAAAVFDSVDTNIPFWQWPRLGLALLRAGPGGVNHRTVDREMVNPFTTNEGAQVLGPNWDAISPVVREMFGVSR